MSVILSVLYQRAVTNLAELWWQLLGREEKYDPIWWLYYKLLKIQLCIEWGSAVFLAYYRGAWWLTWEDGGTTDRC